MRIFAASIAAIALAASGAYAQGNGKGNGKGNGGPPAQAQKGPKADRGGGGPGPKANRGQQARGQGNQGVKANRGNGGRANRGGPPAMRGNAQGARGNGNDKVRIDRSARGGSPVQSRGNDRLDRGDNRFDRDIDVNFVDRGSGFGIFRDYDRRVGSLDGCPPGLAKKFNGCQPPGLAKKRASYQPSFFGYRSYGTTPLYYNDGFLLGLGPNGRINASLPLLGGALSIGNAWPNYYQPVEVRPYYQDYYGLQPNGYRYANNALYRVDPETAAITSVAALLTGDDWAVGRPAPAGYGVYNVPYDYRTQYVDGPDGYYRYSDGYVYRMDPETRLVAAAIELVL